MKALILYRCNTCGNLIVMAEASGVNPVCCGVKMERITANSRDAAAEKHVPVVEREGLIVKVRVGSTAHPMVPEHFIRWIVLLTNEGAYVRTLNPGEAPEGTFTLRTGEKPEAAYAYCNLHGLWTDRKGEE